MIEDIRPHAIFREAVLGLVQMLGLPAAAHGSERSVQAALGAWLRHPFSEADAQLPPRPYAFLWGHLLQSQPVVRPLVSTLTRVLSLPATEAHCERIISVLRRTVCPFTFRMTEDTVPSRLASRDL
jgi:hypothetical protein